MIRPSLELLYKILNLLPPKTSRKLVIFSTLQAIATIFDVFALVLLGILSKEGLEFVQSNDSSIDLPLISPNNLKNYTFSNQFALLSTIVIVLFLFRTMLSIWVNKIQLVYLGKQSSNASKEILERLFKSKPQYVISKKTQEVLYGVTVGIDSLVLTYLGSFALCATEILFLLILLTSLTFIQPVAGLCALIVFGISGFLIHRFTSLKARKKSEESGEISVIYNQQLVETLSLYRELFLKGSVLDMTAEVQHLRDRYLKLRSDLMFLPTYSKYLFEFVLIVGGAVVTGTQFLITNTNEAIGSLVVFLAASSRILPSIVRLQGAILTLKQSEGSGQITLRQIEEFDFHRDEKDTHYSDENEEFQKSDYLLVTNLEFGYPGSNDLVLRRISFSVKKGQLVAIVGESGAGKSTLADLILGIQEPTTGHVKINGLSPRAFIKRYPGSLAYVPQDISIVDGTVRKNVVLSERDRANERDVIAALIKASLWDEIQLLPQGIESIVGERGMKLSGGQRQRLGIARALYSKPDIMVFDEATSSLDPVTEKAVTDAVYNNQDEVTLIVIAHRLSTVMKADLVILLENGELVTSGTFEEVRAKSPSFNQQAKLVNL